jgi:hypothetical protein
MKRTTLLLDDELLSELRRRAATERITLTEVVERTLRLGLAAPPRRSRIALPSYDLGPFLRAFPGPEARDRGPGRREG